MFITAPTLKKTRLPRQEFPIQPFLTHEPVWIGDLCITAFPKQHDACDPHSFLVSSQGTTVGVFTDIGVACEQVIHHFNQCHAAFLEANYDEDLLEHGRYPYHLKHRIRGGSGHLSNQQALALFRTHKPEFMSHVLLSHLSGQNNSPQLVHDLFAPHVNATKLIVTSRSAETPLFTIDAASEKRPA